MKDPPTHQPTLSGRTVTNDFTFHAIDLQLSNMCPLVCMCVWLLVGVSPCGRGCLGVWLLGGVSPCGCGCLWVCSHVDVAACGCVPMWMWLLVGVSPCGRGCLWVCPHVDVAASGCVCVGVTVRVCMQESAARVGEYEHVSQCCIVIIRAIMFTCPSLISMPHRLLRTYVEANRYTHTCTHTRHTPMRTHKTHTCAHRHTHT